VRDIEKNKYLAWEKLSPTQQHMILMYFYRVETTTIDDMDNYVETYHFKKYGIKRTDLPSWFTDLSPDRLREVAYSVIGKTVTAIHFNTTDYSDYLPGEPA